MMSSQNALSDAALSGLIYRLRYANARYGQIACQLRCRMTITRTYHAQRRAFWSGLRVDIAKAKGCPSTAISVRPLPVLDTTPSPLPLMLSSFARTAETHNELGLEIPDIVVSSPDAYVQPHKRLVIRIPPLASLHDDMYRHEHNDMSAPGAPLIRTKELPECEMDEMISSRSSSSASSTPLLTPIDIVCSGLRIKIPARKRKLGETDDENSCPDSSNIQFPKKHMRKRWARSQMTNDRLYWPPRSQIASL
ncbi:uncharacterized protein BJ212DRAFT_369591 [Suillus subaureus]|uniref:Uncharacterized protein n=1 Tax=Suillus subaureus TaxID=48587 RepID=A0A9P7E966_9AGAM|nr:uncharacterized protein BJ212DRAFT_369591 [Suillus subaureus]KAG1814406.1 hypothetical protein BJ212DRAFT_369591 [Suillus subaureus]